MGTGLCCFPPAMHKKNGAVEIKIVHVILLFTIGSLSVQSAQSTQDQLITCF